MAYKNKLRSLSADERRLRQARRERRQAKKAAPPVSGSLLSLMWQLFAPELRAVGKAVIFLPRMVFALYFSRRVRGGLSRLSQSRRVGGADDPAEAQRLAEEVIAVLEDKRLVPPK